MTENRHKIDRGDGSGSGFFLYPDPDRNPVCPVMLDPDSVNIRPVPKPWLRRRLVTVTDDHGFQIQKHHTRLREINLGDET